MNCLDPNTTGPDKQTLGWYADNAPQVAAGYQQVSCDTPLYRSMAEFAFAGRTPQTADALRLLDIGCGSGRDLAWWQAQGAQVQGLDACKEMLDEAERLYPRLSGKLYVDSLPQLANSADHSYDVLFCSAVLMHLPLQALDSAAQSFKRLLKPGGKLIISIPLQGPQLAEDFRSLADGRLFSPLDQNTLEESLGAAGFFAAKKHQSLDSMGRSQRSWLTIMFKLV